MSDSLVLPILALEAWSVPWSLFWPYFAGLSLLVVGLASVLKTEAPRSRGLDKAIVFGRVLLAVPMAVFGTEHFVFSSQIAGMVPSWLPGHLFWTYLTGSGLIAAGLSIAVRRFSGLAAALLGFELLSFVTLISIPNILKAPHDRFILAVFLRDLSFSVACFALAITEGFRPFQKFSKASIASIRSCIGVAALVFGVEHFLHPDFVPVVPLPHPMPTWIPGHSAIAYIVGIALIAFSASTLSNWKARSAAAVMGLVVVAVVVIVYLPMLISEPSVEVGLNYFADTLAFGGAVLVLGGALPNHPHSRARTQ